MSTALLLAFVPFMVRCVSGLLRKIPAMAIWLLLSVLLVAGVLPASAQSCGAVPGGPPNSCPDVASLGGNGGPDAGAGNPINVMTGNKYQREVDMPALPGVLGLEIIRHYNSAYSRPDNTNGSIGRGWRLSYETEVVDQLGRIQVLQGDGGRVIFERDAKHPDQCRTPNPANGTMVLTRQANGLDEYTWSWTNGRTLHFNSLGKLDQISAPSGEVVSLHYDSRNQLVRVTDPQGRSLDLIYFDSAVPNHFHGVQFIDSPAGRFEYQYGSALPKGSGRFDTRQLLALLVKVRLPSDKQETATSSRLYHHEDPRNPWLMTGISIETTGNDKQATTTRYATFGYDSNARAILSTHAGNIGKVTLDTSEGGNTVLTNSLGQKTSYRHTIIAGEHRLLEVRGAGCALCGPTNLRYGYNGAGQLTETTKLSEDGQPVSTTKTEFDQLGRTSRISKFSYLQGKAQPAQWWTRFEYQGKRFAPVVIALPSVVSGKEALTQIHYNAAGQPLSVTETGWTPGLDQLTAKISRTTRYRYAMINGSSLLTEIDGPLPNGRTNSPLDSDITVIEYDHRSNTAVTPKAALEHGLEPYQRRDGLLSRIIAPGNFITEVVERDVALRPGTLRTIDGKLIQVTTVANNWRGQPVDIERVAGALSQRLHYDYNAFGQVTAIILPGKLRTRFQYDQAEQISKILFPDGSGILTSHDTEGRTERTTRYLDVAGEPTDNLPDIHFGYDRPAGKPSRLTQVDDALGLVKSYRYNDVGQVAAISNAFGVASEFNYDTTGLLASHTDAAGSRDAATVSMRYDSAGHATHITSANDIGTLRRYDDFGRKVMETDPDHGITLFSYDAADHMLARIDETRVTTRYTYDHANRLLALGADQQANVVQYRYEGQRLVSVVSTSDGKPEHAIDRTEYQHDAFGLVIKETRWFASLTPQSDQVSVGLSFVTTSAYDEAGRLIKQTLPDGHRLQYRYARADDGAASRPSQLEAILFDDNVIVTAIEQSIAGGMTGYTMSNGMRQQISLDRRGRIEQLRVLGASTESWWMRCKAWFFGNKSGSAAQYRQINRYDEGGRLVQINRQSPSATRSERYGYDNINRLSTLVGSDGADTTFRYDKGGNRIAETSAPDLTNRAYHYAPGTNRLLAITADAEKSTAIVAANSTLIKPADIPQLLRSAWFYHPTGVQLAQLQWLKDGGETAHRRTVYSSGKRPIAVYENERLIARYHYNRSGERIAKTVFPAQSALASAAHNRTNGNTTYSLYRGQRLSAETDSAGRITAHYIYLNGKPVAKIEMAENNSDMHRLWKALTMRAEPDTSDRTARIYAIITDHLGTPQQVVDEDQHMVWHAITAAFGQARVIYAAITGPNARPFVMNLRLPGQIFDEETNLHYNYQRDYDPAVGRYTTPDPAGLSGGFNPYSYAGSNPLVNIDPLGLYEIDVHYYMTYTLAITAGLPKDAALQLALAAQYVDDNPFTTPINFGSLLTQTDRLSKYHFTQSGYDPVQLSGQSNDAYELNRVDNPVNPQLNNLLMAANNVKNSTCTKIQLFGEYLHAYEDTFGHRNRINEPIDVNGGLGHALYGHESDKTYNGSVAFGTTIYPMAVGLWNLREDHTLRMEEDTFNQIKREFGGSAKDKSGKEIIFSTISESLKIFNHVEEDEENTHSKFSNNKANKKRDELMGVLAILGFSDIQSYDLVRSCKNRQKNISDAGLLQKNYPGTILETPSNCVEDR